MACVTKPSRRWKLNNWLWLTVEAFEEWSDALFAQACWEAGMKDIPRGVMEALWLIDEEGAQSGGVEGMEESDQAERATTLQPREGFQAQGGC
jgi:hypothetical protein